ncbi:hypothetical protein FHS85_002243 [Rhodoligotrophos appendicifer]|uniref:hypothetical protein n=1 Tax=Rhodoligotrophos appendicifer TaxID=987056 RepID=UPI0011866459|nr:hypothetical protein [Rhodoligotrophos appendicifer]
MAARWAAIVVAGQLSVGLTEADLESRGEFQRIQGVEFGYVYAPFTPRSPIEHCALMRSRNRYDAPETMERPMLDILFIALAAGFFLGAAACVRLLERL